MKKLFALVVMSLLIFTFACDDDENNDSSKLIPLTLGQDYTGTIAADGKQYFTFTTTVAGDYQISLTELDTDCGWVILDYLSDDTDYFKMFEDDDYIGGMNDFDDSSDEVDSDSADASTKYVIIVFNFDESGNSSFTLNVKKI